MNLNPDKVKQLVLAFSELDEEYQDRLLKEALKLELMQSQKNQLKKENAHFKTEDEFQQAVDERTNKVAVEAIHLIEIMKKISETDKATLLMLGSQLAGKGNSVKESDISITVKRV